MESPTLSSELHAGSRLSSSACTRRTAGARAAPLSPAPATSSIARWVAAPAVCIQAHHQHLTQQLFPSRVDILNLQAPGALAGKGIEYRLSFRRLGCVFRYARADKQTNSRKPILATPRTPTSKFSYDNEFAMVGTR